jgi:hypothetical protein
MLFLGDCGRGKSTHLHALHAQYPDVPLTYVGPGERPRIPAAPVVFVDEVQRLSRRRRARLFRRRASFVLTSHEDHGHELEPGTQHTDPFEFTLPKEGPYTYHGKNLNVDWQLEARSDIAWARDPVAREDILVTPGDVVPRVTEGNQKGPMLGNRPVNPQRVQRVMLAVALVAFAGGIVAVLLTKTLFPCKGS